ncbi:hypothetical protein MUP05_01430 [Candidatus Bathyarchaeota archaeon]|nr:hypothetical protein [Candidatus Bathyarchaeota archaeon]
MLAYLNSSIGAMLTEVYGRSYGGGVLDLKVYEAKQLPVLDPSTLRQDERHRVSLAFKSLVKTIEDRFNVEDEFEKLRSKSKGAKGLFEGEARMKLDEAIRIEEKARRKLDETIYDILDLTVKERKQVQHGLQELQELRRLRTMA